MGEKTSNTDPLIALADKLQERGITPADIEDEDPDAANILRFLYGMAADEEEISLPRKGMNRSSSNPLSQQTDIHHEEPEILFTSTGNTPTQTSFLPNPYQNPEREWEKTHRPNGKKKHK